MLQAGKKNYGLIQIIKVIKSLCYTTSFKVCVVQLVNAQQLLGNCRAAGLICTEGIKLHSGQV
jgi:hypothetical protein